jgi:hypothetical protein
MKRTNVQYSFMLATSQVFRSAFLLNGKPVLTAGVGLKEEGDK